MRVSSFQPSNFSKLDIIFSGNLIIAAGAIAFVLFVLFYFLVLPLLCYIPSSNYGNPFNFDTSRCAATFPILSYPSPTANSGGSISVCHNAPDFPWFLLFCGLAILAAFAVNHFEK